MFNALTIAGSDSCGGAGIQADLKAFSANGVYGMSVITAITAQNTQGVFGIMDVEPNIITKQIEVIFEDIKVGSIKIGMVSKIESIKAIGKTLRNYKNLPPIILDPVMISKSGFNLLSVDAKEALIEELIPLATLITPNLPEAEALLERKIETIDEMKEAAKDILKMGPKYVLIKGGHLKEDATDLFYDGESITLFPQERLKTIHTHGTGCTLSSTIAANLSKGMTMKEAVGSAKEYVTGAIKYGFKLGKGVGPTHHFYKFYKDGINN
ncbi:bifunctional hydroxymethylpyrimidine kinase/phosphomethylpyrimidine kinase [Clostridium tarantellae]|uniref:Hydroxymethylpyrimidine/phosphomethylpyrimidine kinase n=1 Tax=Clostridium tarantellae TaxID=39493 RepID=A0A6I1MLQ3_9CLOT|nr:bifunctional hydroxymethylpyrimidine kinase/phosphomethylpyrimidine kinase [Clostridium tarantellae]MPQ43047.1 bifunctional hydroxymethylpyrimidine kinase/phosphomethylpyrimidine kinase [Clostridium tarantellae]